MAFNNFIETVMATGIERELERMHVFAADTNRKYEGTVKQKGDSVKILGVGKPTIYTTNDRNFKLSDAETVEDTSVIMPIDQIAYFNYKINDIDEALASPTGIMSALSEETSEGLADEMDRYIANLSKAREAVLDNVSPTTVTADNVLGLLDNALMHLYSNDVKPSTTITATVSPRFYMILKQALVKNDTDNSDFLKNGQVNRYGNMIIRLSNNVAKSGSGDLIQVKTQRAIAFVRPHIHTEPYRPEKDFSDAVKGFVLYGAKIVRPKEMINLNVAY